MVDIQGPPAVNFYSMLSGLGDTIAQSRQDAARRQALAAATTPGPDGSVDYGKAILGLVGTDPQAANTFAALQNHKDALAQQDIANKRAAEAAAQAERHFQANYKLQERAANRADEDKYLVKEVTNPDGSTTLVRINTKGNEGPINTGVAPSQPNNPFAVGPKLTQDQGKSATMVDRMNEANKTITGKEDINEGFFGKMGGMAAAIPKVRDSAAFNMIATPERQQVIQAQRNFVNAILRVESGAAISQSEFDNAQRQYFPQPGDSKEVILQKRQNRVTAMQGMAREAGPQYKPPADLLPAKPGSGNVTSNGVKWSVE